MKRLIGALVRTTLAVSACACTGAVATSPNDSAAALLAKHRAYVGWQFGDGTFGSMRIEGYTAGADGKKSETVVRLAKGLLYHDVYTMLDRGGATIHTGFTGRLFWHSDINGFTTPIYGDYAKYLASLTILQQEGTTELPATYLGEKSVDGTTTGLVRVTLAHGDAIDCYVDPHTGAYVQATIDPGGSYETTIHIVSYADVLPGKKMIASYRVGAGKAIHVYDKIEPNAAVTDEALHPPAPAATWTFGAPQAFPIAVTHQRILVDAAVNGVEGRFILDTGATAIVLDEAFADRAHVAVLRGKNEAATMYGVVPTRMRRAQTIALGGSTLHDAIVFSEDFRSRDYRGLDRAGYDGLLGYDLFAGAIVKLDVYGSKMTILDPATDLSDSPGLPLLLDLSEGIPAIPMVLNKSLPVNALLDTGNPGVVFLSYDWVKKHHLTLWASGCGNVDTLSIGPITYAGQAACLWEFSSDYALLGFDFLKHFDYVLDYPHGRMFLAPNKN